MIGAIGTGGQGATDVKDACIVDIAGGGLAVLGLNGVQSIDGMAEATGVGSGIATWGLCARGRERHGRLGRGRRKGI